MDYNEVVVGTYILNSCGIIRRNYITARRSRIERSLGPTKGSIMTSENGTHRSRNFFCVLNIYFVLKQTVAIFYPTK